MEGVMMRAPSGIALAVRTPEGEIVTEYTEYKSKAQKGSFWGIPIVRGAVSFVESLVLGMKTLTRSAEMAGEEIEEEPTKFELWLSKVFGKSIEKIIIGVAVVLAVVVSVGLFFVLPTTLGGLIFRFINAAPVVKSLTEGCIRLMIFLGYLVLCSKMKEVSRVFMYHGAEHKTIACYEAEVPITPANAAKYSRLHPRCGTNYLFLVMAISILFFAVVGWNSNYFIRLGTRLLLLPVVAGLSYEVLRWAAKYDNVLTRIVRAPGMALQRLSTREPDADMIEVAIAAFDLAMEKMEEEAHAG